MDLPVTYHSEFQYIMLVPMLVTVSLCIFGVFFLPVISILFILLAVFVLLVVPAAWYLTRYVFETDGLRIRLPLKFNEPLIAYSEVRKVTVPGLRHAHVHGMSRNTVGISYDMNHYITFSPTDIEAVLEILQERCPGAIFVDKRVMVSG